ncbi:XRE family transcriptional regulator [Streptomyces sp. AC627_RSS907]|uniref:XRE family transcriptional regulator n=1 Tax=Streptomyces sp. AC627_RSS907 TaxID=2823684 RepID=UPI001C232B6D|nr:XRE family transcriptional regulator [Streptomyces sp. AC627_RSS907]
MPRWKALPDELDPQIREFTSQLRRLVDRSELSVASVADATGYSKTSWERYLSGRLLAPKGAVVALAEVTGTNPVHLTTMWELAERAWSRSEMRHDMTMEAIRISQARAALGELGTPPAQSGTGGKSSRGGRMGRHGGAATATPGIAGPAGVAPTLPPPTVPAQPTAADSPDSAVGAVRGGGATGVAPSGTSSGAPSAASSVVPPATSTGAPYGTSSGGPTDGNSWGLAGYRGPAPTGGSAARPGTGPGVAAGTAPMPAVVPGHPEPSDTYGEPPRGGSSEWGRSSGGGSKRTMTFVAGVVGVLVVIAGAFFLLNDGGDKKNEGAKPSPSPTASSNPQLPPGVKCSGDLCTGKDPEAMGCGGDLVTTAATATVGTAAVEVRYSKTCGAAWARVTQAAQGDEVQVSAGGRNAQTGAVTGAGDTVAYTPMVAVKTGAEAKACVTLASGQKGCTE